MEDSKGMRVYIIVAFEFNKRDRDGEGPGSRNVVLSRDTLQKTSF